MASVHQKQPPPNTAISLFEEAVIDVEWDDYPRRLALMALVAAIFWRFTERRLAVFLERELWIWTDALFAMGILLVLSQNTVTQSYPNVNV